METGPAGIRLFLLPGFCDLQQVRALDLGAAERGLSKVLFVLLGRIGADPGARLGAERGFLRGVVEVHSLLSLLVIPGWSEGPDPESGSYLSRDSGFDATHRSGMTITPRS